MSIDTAAWLERLRPPRAALGVATLLAAALCIVYANVVFGGRSLGDANFLVGRRHENRVRSDTPGQDAVCLV